MAHEGEKAVLIGPGGGKNLSSDPASATSNCLVLYKWTPALSLHFPHLLHWTEESYLSGRWSGPGPIYPCLSQDGFESQTLKVRKVLRDP